MSCNMGSIRQIHQRLISEGYNISEYMLRRLVKSGTIRAIYSGNKALISYEAVLNVLNTGGIAS